MVIKMNFFSVFVLIFFCFKINAQAKSIDELKRLEIAYPQSIQRISEKFIIWKDGKRMLIRGSVPLLDSFTSKIYNLDQTIGSISKNDIKRDRYEPFFKKMYGKSANEVKKKLVTIYWMPRIFGMQYPLKVTTINGVDQKLRHISSELEKLPRSYYKYLANPAGGFYWRKVAHQSYLSSHSFGIAIDINSSYANYWLWDLQKSKRQHRKLYYQNHIPLRIVQIFEKEGFLWGGRWNRYYDTMHFEYRPEVFIPA
jgi:peptidoglycan L-alanyl-D-glutamate endopeptidase CwlK